MLAEDLAWSSSRSVLSRSSAVEIGIWRDKSAHWLNERGQTFKPRPTGLTTRDNTGQLATFVFFKHFAYGKSGKEQKDTARVGEAARE